MEFPKDEKQALQLAYDNEKMTNKLYLDAEKNSRHKLIKKTFTFLAKWEKEHMDMIKAMMEKKGYKETSEKHKRSMERFLKDIVKHKGKKIIIIDKEQDAYKNGLEIEENSYEYYKQGAKSASEETKKFFKFMMKEEDRHYRFLQSIFSFIEIPENFFVEEEKWLFEG